jgi:CoA-transferase family III
MRGAAMKSILPNAVFDERPLFSGLRVLDIASFIAGPTATTVLSDFGAEVVKVEAPGMGDPYRHTYLSPPNPSSKENYAWQLTNRNKRSLVVDLKNPHSAEVLARLVKWADVLVTNFPPRVRQRLGVIRRMVCPPDRRRRLTPPNTVEVLEPLLECSSRAGSMLESDGGRSSALIYRQTDDHNGSTALAPLLGSSFPKSIGS